MDIIYSGEKVNKGQICGGEKEEIEQISEDKKAKTAQICNGEKRKNPKLSGEEKGKKNHIKLKDILKILKANTFYKKYLLI